MAADYIVPDHVYISYHDTVLNWCTQPSRTPNTGQIPTLPFRIPDSSFEEFVNRSVQ
jgi:hypothetical protein